MNHQERTKNHDTCNHPDESKTRAQQMTSMKVWQSVIYLNTFQDLLDRNNGYIKNGDVKLQVHVIADIPKGHR